MNELYFMGLDVAAETKTLVNFTTSTCTEGMTESELKAYNLGVKNTLAALKSALEDEAIVVNIDGMKIPTEMNFEDLKDYFCED